MNASSCECNHQRGTARHRSSAVTICCGCRDFLCSICGVTIEWHEGLGITNPGVQWRYCARDACIKAEAAYHGLPLDEMIQRRGELRDKRVLKHFQDRGIEPQPSLGDTLVTQTTTLVTQTTASGAQRIFITPRAFVLDPGEACWCNLGKACDGNHEIGPIEVVNICGNCGQEFQILDSDPHWSTG